MNSKPWMILTAAALAPLGTFSAAAQDAEQPASSIAEARSACMSQSGTGRSACLDNLKRREAGAAANGTDAKAAKLFNTTAEAARAKATAGDLAGASALYQTAIDANPKTPVLSRLYLGLAMSLRRQGVAAFNAGGKGIVPGPGATNDEIRAANVANAALEADKRAAALPLIARGLEAAAKAATLSEAQADRNADDAIGIELREGAAIMYSLDRSNVLRSGRLSAAVEAKWLRKWLVAVPAAPIEQVRRYGVATAAGLLATDGDASLTLADEVLARAGDDPEAVVGYAEIVGAAKRPVGDARRTQAMARLTQVQGRVTDPGLQRRLSQARAALAPA